MASTWLTRLRTAGACLWVCLNAAVLLTAGLLVLAGLWALINPGGEAPGGAGTFLILALLATASSGAAASVPLRWLQGRRSPVGATFGVVLTLVGLILLAFDVLLGLAAGVS